MEDEKKLKTFTFRITETFIKNVETDAETEEEAYDAIGRMYGGGKIYISHNIPDNCDIEVTNVRDVVSSN